MTVPVPSPVEVRRDQKWPRWVVAGLTARRAGRSGALWGYIFGIFVASTALGFAATYKTVAAREHLAATFATNPGIDALIGQAHDVQTVAGFTAWRSMGVLSIIGAVWGILAGTRLLRGEEDAGRFELLLAGRTTRRGATGQAIAGLGVGAAALFTVTALVTVVVGRSSKVHLSAGRGLFLALALVASAVMFLAVGALTSQLGGTRRRAASYGAGLLGASFALRLVADSGTGLGWLRWATPLGWVEDLSPVAHPNPMPLLPIAALTGVAVALAVGLAGRRDLGASVVPDRVDGRPHTLLLRGPGSLALRLARPSLLGWLGGTAAMSFVMGYIAKPAGSAITASASARRVLERLGAAGNGPRVFLGATLLMVSLLICLCAAAQIVAMRSSESDGHLEHLFVRPVRRVSWLAKSLGVNAAALVALGLVTGCLAWAGGALQHSGVPFGELLAAGLNLVAPAWCVLGVGALALGIWPRATSAVAYGLLSWAFLVDFIGGITGLNHWILDTSLFHQITAAPAQPVHWGIDAVVAAIGLAAACIGAVAFSRRDLQGA